MEVALIGALLPREPPLRSFLVSPLDLGISFWKDMSVQRHLFQKLLYFLGLPV